MESLAQHPGFQSAVAPFLSAMVVALLLLRTRVAGLAIVVGIVMCAWLAIGLDLFPLTSTRRVLLTMLLASVVGASVDWRQMTFPTWPLAIFGALAGLFAVYPALLNAGDLRAVAEAVGLATFCVVVIYGFDRLRDDAVRSGAAGVGTGMGVGVACVLGASASLGQLGIAVAAAAGGVLLVVMVRGTLHTGRAATLTLGIATALLAAAGMVLADVPWYALPLIAAIPFIAGLPLLDAARPAWMRATAHTTVAVVAAAVAIGVMWVAMEPAAASSGY
jgi:hypothetical protein